MGSNVSLEKDQFLEDQKIGPLDTLPGGKETILLVEDDQAVRSVTQTILTKLGYTVLVASQGKEALRLMEQHPGHIDLLISDVVMPEMGGRQLTETLLSVETSMRVLIISGYPRDTILRHGVWTPNTPFLSKPFHPSALARTVRSILDHERVTG